MVGQRTVERALRRAPLAACDANERSATSAAGWPGSGRALAFCPLTLSTTPAAPRKIEAMAADAQSPLDLLWKEYSLGFRDFDDLTLARWMAQTLGQLEGKSWRLSHPLLGAYRLAAQLAVERQIWLKRLATPPAAYAESACCRAPILPLLTRDVRESGLVCQHCSDTLISFEEVPTPLRTELGTWAAKYSPIHEVAHWDETQRKTCGDYNRAYEQAAKDAERLLAAAGCELAPKLLEFYPTVVWEDQDECLEIRPEDVAI